MPQIFHLSYAILFFISAGANKITGIGKEKISPWHGAGPQEQVLPEQPCDAFNLFQQKTRLKEIVTRIVAPGDPVPILAQLSRPLPLSFTFRWPALG